MALATLSMDARASARVAQPPSAVSGNRRWSTLLLHLLVIAGAAAVVSGSYMTWATFYGGLIARNGVPGHGKYFIGLAAATVVSVALPRMPGVWSGVRWLAVPAGLVIAAVAFRDLRNLEALVHDPAAGFYLPGQGPGLVVVLTGALVLVVAPLARPVRASARMSLTRTAAALLVVAGVAMLIPGVYGEYYLHVAQGHASDHAESLDTAHLLTAGGILALAGAAHAWVVGRGTAAWTRAAAGA